MILPVYEKLEKLVLEEFADIVVNAKIICSANGRARKLRLNIFDGSYIDIWLSEGREYSYHWERTNIDGKFFRHDNAPHARWKKVETFPKHFHEGSNKKVIASHISPNPLKAVRIFLLFTRQLLMRQA